MNMTMTYDGTMVMPKNFAVVTEDEMTYVDGGGVREIVDGVLGSLIGAALIAIGKKFITTTAVLTALHAAGAAAKAVWACVTAACAFVWNHPAMLACLAGAVGIGVGIVIGHYCL